MSSKPKIIIKRVKKADHGGAHGGSWKVAYADFVTAMMAFFLLLWLLTMSAPEKRARVSAYFKHFNLFDKAGVSMVMDKAGGLIGEGGGDYGKLEQEQGKGSSEMPSPEKLREKLQGEVGKKLTDLKDQIMVETFEGGVRIQLVDKEGNSLFSLGAAAPSANAKKILSVLAENIKDLNNKVAIEGHTDGLSYSSSRYTNWELSTDRASAARKELENFGLSPDRLVRVAGCAATEPLIKEDPNDPRNRRISILLLFPKPKAVPETRMNEKDSIPPLVVPKIQTK